MGDQCSISDSEIHGTLVTDELGAAASPAKFAQRTGCKIPSEQFLRARTYAGSTAGAASGLRLRREGRGGRLNRRRRSAGYPASGHGLGIGRRQ